MARCGWCKRRGVIAGEPHTVPQRATGRVTGRGGNVYCQGYTTFVRLGEATASADRSEQPREIRG